MGCRVNHLFCFGLGYTALALAARLRSEGWQVSGTSTTPEKQAALIAQGFPTLLFSRQAPIAADRFAGVTHVVSSVPPDRDGDPVVQVHGRDLLSTRSLRWLGYLSTTGVYGDRDGATVDEDSELRPSNERSVRRVGAERQWLGLWRARGLPVHLFRLAGIYGSGRNPLDVIRAGQARRIIKPGLVLGRIHVDDLVGILLASMAHPHAGVVYNVTDDEPVAPAEIVTYGCQLLGVVPPPEESHRTAEMSPLLREFYADSKRVANRRIREELGYRLRYPTYRAGLDALLREPPAAPRRAH
ncbi:MAG: SDR family oxidoreductase [Alphaproteobacteria bacterium]|nr:SDR family oxidoreductase [Alphaproteobacteria bacterium]